MGKAHSTGCGGCGQVWVAANVVCFFMLHVAVPALADPPTVSAKEYQLFKDWDDGRQDPRLDALGHRVKMVKIARTLGVSAKDLERAVNKVAPVADSLGLHTENGIQQAIGRTPLAGRVLEVHVDARQGHVVSGVKWLCGDMRDVEKEASYAAWAVSTGGAIVQTALLWCVDGADVKWFSATIGRPAVERIRRPQIERFGRSRYIRLFEDVKIGAQRS